MARECWCHAEATESRRWAGRAILRSLTVTSVLRLAGHPERAVVAEGTVLRRLGSCEGLSMGLSVMPSPKYSLSG